MLIQLYKYLFFNWKIYLQGVALGISEASYIPDLVCTGIWGGAYLVMFACIAEENT
jgi:hypothetical protein